jgi:hypothetical protein
MVNNIKTSLKQVEHRTDSSKGKEQFQFGSFPILLASNNFSLETSNPCSLLHISSSTTTLQ